MASQPIDQGAILRSGALLIPDLQAQYAQRDQMDLQRQQVGFQQQQFQQKQAEDQREQQQANSYAADIQAIQALPVGQQPQAIAALMQKYPKQSEALKRSYDAQDAAVRDADMREVGEMFSLVQNGATDKAAIKLRKRIEADKAAGQDTSDDEAIAAALESGDPAQVQAATAQIGMMLSLGAGPDKFASTYAAVKPDVTNTEQVAQYIERTEGAEAARLYRQGIYDPLATVPLPGGRTYVGPRSGLAGVGQFGGGGGYSTPGIGDDIARHRNEDDPPSGDRGTRNNNPGNLKDGPFARRQPGYKGSDGGGFAVFASPTDGAGAQERLLSANYLAKGHDTPAKVISRYAPAGENSPASMNNYAAYVARRLGIGVNDKVPAGKAGLMAKAMREFETGKTVKGSAAPANGPKRVTSIAQARSLPSGTEFIDPTGKRRRVP